MVIPIYSERNWEWFIAAVFGYYLCCHWRLKTRLVRWEVGSTGFYRGWIFSLLWLWSDGFFALLCMEGIDSFFPSPLSSQARVPPLPALHLRVASWSDKLRQSRGCGSLNQHSLHAFTASSPFFLQRQRKQPQLPTCQEEMTHRQPLDFSQRRFCGCAPRPLAQSVCLQSCPEPDPQQRNFVCVFLKTYYYLSTIF